MVVSQTPNMTIELSEDEALVLFELLVAKRHCGPASVDRSITSPSGTHWWGAGSRVERKLVAPFRPDYPSFFWLLGALEAQGWTW